MPRSNDDVIRDLNLCNPANKIFRLTKTFLNKLWSRQRCCKLTRFNSETKGMTSILQLRREFGGEYFNASYVTALHLCAMLNSPPTPEAILFHHPQS